jgi:hypothetical protein
MKKGFISHFRTGTPLSFLPYLIMGQESHNMILTIFLFGPNLKIFAKVYILFFNYVFFKASRHVNPKSIVLIKAVHTGIPFLSDIFFDATSLPLGDAIKHLPDKLLLGP